MASSPAPKEFPWWKSLLWKPRSTLTSSGSTLQRFLCSVWEAGPAVRVEAAFTTRPGINLGAGCSHWSPSSAWFPCSTGQVCLSKHGCFHPPFLHKQVSDGRPIPYFTHAVIFPAGKGTRGKDKTAVVSLASGNSPCGMSCRRCVRNRYKPWEALTAPDPLNFLIWWCWCSFVLWEQP